MMNFGATNVLLSLGKYFNSSAYIKQSCKTTIFAYIKQSCKMNMFYDKYDQEKLVKWKKTINITLYLFYEKDANTSGPLFQNTSFKKYRETIDALIEAIKETYNGTAIWRSSTAIHKQSIPIMGSFRRYITSQVLQSKIAFSYYVLSFQKKDICCSSMKILSQR